MATKSIRMSDGTDTLLPESAVSGTNYIKLADGTLMQWGQADKTVGSTSSWGSLYIADIDAITYPIAFNAAPEVFVSPAGSSSFMPITVQTNASSITRIQLTRGTAFSSSVTLRWLAIGRWKS